MKKRIFTILMAILITVALVPCVLAVDIPSSIARPNDEVLVAGATKIQVRKSTDADWDGSDHELELTEAEMAGTVDFRCTLDTDIIKAAITNPVNGWYEYGLELGKWAYGNESDAVDMMRVWNVKGQFTVKITYPNTLDIPDEYTADSKSMYGFNDNAKELFEETERTVVVGEEDTVLTIKIAIKDVDNDGKDGIAEQSLYEGIKDGTYLNELTFTVEGVNTGVFTEPLTVTGEMVKSGSFTDIQIGKTNENDDKVYFYTNELSATLNPKDDDVTPGGVVTRNYKVTFNVDGDTSLLNPIYTSGTVKLSKLPTPEKVGYKFDGWYLDSEMTQKVTEDFKISKNIVLYGHMTSDIVNTEDHFAYVIGYPDETVRPLRNITREEVAMIFYRLLRDDVRDSLRVSTNDFTDVADDRWSNVAISTMANGDFILGYPDGTFGPEKPITRAEFATIATRFASLLDESGATFSDIDTHWSKPYVLRAATAGWIAGYPDGTFLPEQPITRAEAMTIINRVLMRSVNKEGLHADATLWIDMKGDEWYYYIVLEATNSHDYARQADGINENWTEIVPNKTWD